MYGPQVNNEYLIELIKDRMKFLYNTKITEEFKDPALLKKVDKKATKNHDLRILPSYFYDMYSVFDDQESKECICSFSQIGMLDPFPHEIHLIGLKSYKYDFTPIKIFNEPIYSEHKY
jgi:hypothetical protein